MDCDCVALAAHMRAQSPTAPASARTPAERLREVWSEERGWPWCWCRALGVAAAALSALPRVIRASSTALRRSGRRETQEERSQQQSVTAAGAAAVRRSSPSSPAPRSPLQQLESMATALESRCPICLDTWDNVGYVMPCLHQFCFRCIQQWVESKPECPLCKRRVSSIVHSVRADNEFKEVVIPAPAEASLITQPAGRARGRAATTDPRHRPAAPPSAAGPALVGGLQPEVWASLLRDHPTLIRPVLPWLRQELRRIHGADHAEAQMVEDLLTSAVGLLGLDEDRLVQLMQLSMPEHAATFVHRLIGITVQRCSWVAHRLLGLEGSRAAMGQAGSPAAAPRPSASREGPPGAGAEPSNSAAGASTDELAGSSSVTLQGSRSQPPSSAVPVPRNQEAPQEETPEAVPGASTADQGRDHPQRGPRRAPKRRAPTSQASSPAAKKRPPRRQH
ncbi:uncharacterized protein [Anas platyrhynchos]|uniref:uncharacterized protein n=1 Tax=Anas platyrhynchos TaxID=8839 RepID=UPI003AF2A0F6